MSRKARGPEGPATQPLLVTQVQTGASAPDNSSADDRTMHQATISQAPSSGSASDNDIPAATGSRYRIVGMHARGGLGIVYIAEDTELRRRVALKEIQIRHSHDARSRHRFVQEAEITGRLAHPGIVPVHGLGTHADGRPFYAMRFVEGETLLEAIQKFHKMAGQPHERRMALRQLLTRFLDVCNAVAYAHNQGVIHRDLKPANVLLGHFGETLLVDWGLAKYTGVCQAETTALSHDDAPPRMSSASSGDFTLLTGGGTIMGAAIGTPAYMSPEQAAGRWDDVGLSTDVYSLGATLYTLLTGEPPMPKPGYTGEWLTVPQGGIRPPRELAPDTPRALEAVCRKAMAPRPEDRYVGAVELAADVEHWMGDEAVTALPDGPLTRAGRWVRRHLALVSSVSAAVLVLGLSLTVGVLMLAQANKRISEANTQLSDANQQLSDANVQIRNANVRTLKAVDDFFTDVSENPRLLRKLPGTHELRKALLARARDYYEGFLNERSDDANVQSEAAAACFRLAAIEEMLDPGPKALALYVRARNMRTALADKHPSDPEHSFDLAVTQNHIGKLEMELGELKDSLAELNHAKTRLKSLVDRHPNEPRYGKELGRVLANAAVVLAATGKMPEALASCEEAREILERLLKEQPADAAVRQELGNTLDTFGALQANANLGDAALTTLNRSMELLDGLVKEYPDRSDFAQVLARAANHKAMTLTAMNRRDEALAAHDVSRTLRERLIRENPGVTDFVQELAVTYNNSAVLLRAMGRLPEAIDACSHALTLQQKLSDEHRENIDFARDVARSFNNLGFFYSEQRKRSEAMAAYERARSIQDELFRKQPENSDLAAELGKSCNNMGNLLVALGQRDSARLAHERAREIREKLVERQSAAPAFRLDLAATLIAIGELAKDRGELPAAIDAAGKALQQANALPEVPTRAVKRNALRLQAHALSRLMRHADSLTAWDQAIALTDPPETAVFRLGRAACQVRANDTAGIAPAKAVAEDARAPAVQLIEAARVFALSGTDEHAAMAIALLKRAETAKWFADPARIDALKIDADFANLLKRADGAAWLAALKPD